MRIAESRVKGNKSNNDNNNNNNNNNNNSNNNNIISIVRIPCAHGAFKSKWQIIALTLACYQNMFKPIFTRFGFKLNLPPGLSVSLASIANDTILKRRKSAISFITISDFSEKYILI